MKQFLRLSLLLVCIFLLKNINAQIVDPIKWDFSVKKTSDCEANLILHAKLDDKWHLYGQKPYDDGPVNTTIKFTKSSDYELIGKPSEKTLIKKLEPVFGVELNFFEHEATFTQKIKIKSDKAFEIKGSVESMVCNDVQCMPPTTVDYTFKIAGYVPCPTSSVTPNSENTTAATTSKNCDVDSNKIFN